MDLQIPGYISLLLVGDGDDELYAIHGRIEQGLDGAEFLGKAGVRIPLEAEWLERAKPISEDLRGIFGDHSQCFITLSVSSLPEGADVSSLLPTGLNLWVAP